MFDWLDTRTQALLHGSDPDKIAPPLDAAFSLILLERGQSLELFQRALSRIFEPEKLDNIRTLLDRPCPYVVETSFSFENASLGQFELICANSISVILRDDVALDGDANYLDNLYHTLRRSEEFQLIYGTLLTIPTDDRGQNFCDQFFGSVNFMPPISFSTTLKKGRIMQHWAGNIGAQIEFGL
jgi:hypothetical protein